MLAAAAAAVAVLWQPAAADDGSEARTRLSLAWQDMLRADDHMLAVGGLSAYAAAWPHRVRTRRHWHAPRAW